MTVPALVYDPRYHTFDSWASLMVELYSAQQLEIPSGEENWKAWASGLKAVENFNNEAVPGPYVYDDWHDWASAVLNAVNARVSGAS